METKIPTMLKIILIITFFTLSGSVAQTTHATFTGTVKNEINQPVEATVIVEQYVDTAFVEKGRTVADSFGVYSINLDNVTGIEETENQKPVNFYTLNGNFITVPSKTVAEITEYTIDGQQINKTRVKLSAGVNKLPVKSLKTKASGVYVRRINLNGKTLVQKLININGNVTAYSHKQKIKVSGIQNRSPLQKMINVTPIEGTVVIII